MTFPSADMAVARANFMPSLMVSAKPVNAGATFSLKVRTMTLGAGPVESAAGMDLTRSVWANAGPARLHAIAKAATASVLFMLTLFTDGDWFLAKPCAGGKALAN